VTHALLAFLCLAACALAVAYRARKRRPAPTLPGRVLQFPTREQRVPFNSGRRQS
jgi:hypothetical protein